MESITCRVSVGNCKIARRLSAILSPSIYTDLEREFWLSQYHSRVKCSTTFSFCLPCLPLTFVPHPTCQLCLPSATSQGVPGHSPLRHLEGCGLGHFKNATQGPDGRRDSPPSTRRTSVSEKVVWSIVFVRSSVRLRMDVDEIARVWITFQFRDGLKAVLSRQRRGKSTLFVSFWYHAQCACSSYVFFLCG